MPIFARILDEKYIKTFFMINPIVKTIELPDGRTITLETGKLAKQADGSVMLRMELIRREKFINLGKKANLYMMLLKR